MRKDAPVLLKCGQCLKQQDYVNNAGRVIELEPNACKGKDRVTFGGAVIVTKSGVEELNKLPTTLRVK